MSRLITSLWFLDTVPHNTTGDETALNEDKYGKLISFNHTVVDETHSPNNPEPTPVNIKEDIIEGNYNLINIKKLRHLTCD